jgi:hypothetical protein
MKNFAIITCKGSKGELLRALHPFKIIVPMPP